MIREYINEKLTGLIALYPHSRVRYFNDIDSNIHIIEITPNSIYNSDEKFIDWATDVILDFGLKYPTENIQFLTDDSDFPLTKYDVEFFGKYYNKIPELSAYKNHISYLSNTFSELYSNQLLNEKIFKKLPTDWLSSYISSPSLITHVTVKASPFSVQHSTVAENLYSDIIKTADKKPISFDESGENTYALAA